MKKLILFSCILAFSNIHSYSPTEKINNKTEAKSSIADKIKLCTASIGCLWFSTMAAITYPVVTFCIPNSLNFLDNCLCLNVLPLMSLAKQFGYDPKNIEDVKQLLKINGILSTGAGILLGIYILKKRAQLREKKNSSKRKCVSLRFEN